MGDAPDAAAGCDQHATSCRCAFFWDTMRCWPARAHPNVTQDARGGLMVRRACVSASGCSAEGTDLATPHIRFQNVVRPHPIFAPTMLWGILNLTLRGGVRAQVGQRCQRVAGCVCLTAAHRLGATCHIGRPSNTLPGVMLWLVCDSHGLEVEVGSDV